MDVTKILSMTSVPYSTDRIRQMDPILIMLLIFYISRWLTFEAGRKKAIHNENIIIKQINRVVHVHVILLFFS